MDEDQQTNSQSDLQELSEEDILRLLELTEGEEAEEEETEADSKSEVVNEEKSAPSESVESSTEGDLNVALRKERERTRAERDARIAAEAKLEQYRAREDAWREATRTKDSAKSDDEEELDPVLDAAEITKRELAKQREELRKELEDIRKEQQGALIAHRVATGESDLQRTNELDEYNDLVNIRDPDHFFFQYVSKTPGVLDTIYAAPNPPRYALELARNLKLSDPAYAKQREDKLREKVRAEERARLQELLRNKVKVDKGAPPSVSRMTSDASGTKQFHADVRKMSSDELERAAYE